MTAKITQNVISRRGRKPMRRFNISTRSYRYWQRGNSDHTTVTVIAGLAAMVVVGMLGFFYLHQVIGTASQGSDIRELESQLIEMRERQRELELEGAQLRSLQTVEERINQLNMVEVDRVTYLASIDERVALKTD